jgi:hypothetical protein
MGTKCVPLLTDVFLFSYEEKFIQNNDDQVHSYGIFPLFLAT